MEGKLFDILTFNLLHLSSVIVTQKQIFVILQDNYLNTRITIVENCTFKLIKLI